MNNDLISREAAVEMLREKAQGYFVSMFATSSECHVARVVATECAVEIKALPAVNAESVRHGKCDFCGRGKPIKAYTYLPDCGLQYGIAIEAIYCPKCGEKIDRGAEK